MANFYVGEVLFEAGGTIDTPGDITVTAICDCTGSMGTSGQLLSSTGTALEWITTGSAGIPCSILTAKGDIVVATGAATPTALPVGSDGQLLYACSTSTSGLCWAAAPAGAVQATPILLGTVYACTASNYVALGLNANAARTTGSLNVAIGNNALCSATTAGNNIAIGHSALKSMVSSNQNVAIGTNSMCNATTGGQNTAVGILTLMCAATGNTNTAIGNSAMQCATGSGSVAVGQNALRLNAGAANVGVGNSAGSIVGTGCANTLIGASAGASIDTGSNNIFIGCGADVGADVSCCLAIGSDPHYWLTGDSTSAIKPGAGIIDCAGSCGTAGQVLMSNGSNAICWGTASGGASSATPTVEGIVYGCTPDVANNSQPVALGHSAGAVDAGLYNTWIGYTAGGAHTTGDSNHFVGWGAGCALINGNDNVGLGGRAGAAFGSVAGTPTDANVAIGSDALYCTTGSRNIGIGYIAGCSLTTGSQNLLLGFRVQPPSTTGSCQLAIGFSDSTYWLTGDSTKAIKPGAGIIDCAGSCGVVGQVLCSTGSNAVQWATPQTSPFVTYNSAAITYTNGTPVLVAVWDGGTIQGTFSMNLAGYLNLYTYWNVFLSGDATNYNTGWNQTDFWPPTSDPSSQGTWSVNFPVYPDANNGKWEIYFNPTANSANPTVFTFFYRKLSGNDPIWQI